MVNGRPVPEDLLIPEDDGADAKLVVNLSKVAEAVGLDEDAAQVLEYRRAGVTREVLLNQVAKDDEERRKWQAAWRRVHEHRDKIRPSLMARKKIEKKFVENLPKTRFAHTT
jgi:hypothetical protein